MEQDPSFHSWTISPREAVQLQKELGRKVTIQPLQKKVRLVAGADVSFNKFSPIVYAGIVVLDLATLTVVERVGTVMNVQFPYIPGLLSFREGPPFIEAWKKLNVRPEIMIFDGQGIAHPRRLGIASHLGVLLGIPSIGCAKSLLVGSFTEPENDAGSWTPLLDNQEQIGVALRTKRKTKPIFVSPGHLIDIHDSINIVTACHKGYRVPEPTRLAHLFVNDMRRQQGNSEFPEKNATILY